MKNSDFVGSRFGTPKDCLVKINGSSEDFAVGQNFGSNIAKQCGRAMNS